MNKWYSKKGWATSAVDVPVRSSDDAREIEALLNDGAYYQRNFFTAEDFSAKALPEDEARHQAVLTATTADIDRDAEVVDVKGLNLRMFRKNPVLVWGHNYEEPPIGRSLWEKIEGDKLKSLAQFALRPDDWPDQAEWFPDQVFALCQQKILKGVSIGFLVLDSGPPTEKEIKARNELVSAKKIIRKSMLLEISIVSIGCNPSALVESVSKGIVSKSLVDRLGIELPTVDDEPSLWVWDTKDYEPDEQIVEPVAAMPTAEQLRLEKLKAQRNALQRILQNAPR